MAGSEWWDGDGIRLGADPIAVPFMAGTTDQSAMLSATMLLTALAVSAMMSGEGIPARRPE
ncbi:MAG: hypothetical protein LBH11_01850 [Propionibacteriaceae bacterium]|jgi:hypothetical protein|nr:hypothetical protein [Propionibacteriaceae bacterium]